MLRKLRSSNQGFTLIELMIVIAIIGILAAIAIPNFIAYRNKAFCSSAESDAKSVAAAIADYFAVPTRTDTPNENTDITYDASGDNTYTITGADPSLGITITVTDASGRCPADYQASVDGWDGNNVFTQIMQP